MVMTNHVTLPEPPAPQPTGRMIALFKEGVEFRDKASILEKQAGLSSIDDREARIETFGLETSKDAEGAVILEDLGIAVIAEPDSGRAASIASALASSEGILQIRPEFYLFAIQPPDPPHADTAEATWGLIATGAIESPHAGSGIRVAVLDTGFDQNHPDFAGRTVVTQSFVPNEDVQDVQGHGSHCIGTATGFRDLNGRRYGIAPEAEIYVGKVLDNTGSGAEAWILSGMRWAVQQGCQVISMSLGRATRPGEPPDPLYERMGRFALDRGSLIVAAAGNESSRTYGYIAPVGAPANSPSIMAVAAVDQALAVAEFSCGGINGTGGEVNIAGPGVGVYSSFPLPQRYKTLRGTSMACPHVAGLAALWAASDNQLRGQALWDAVISNAKPLDLPPRDVGAGLVQAPPPAQVG